MKRTVTLRIQDDDDIYTSTIPINPEGPIILEPVAQILRNRYKNPIILSSVYITYMRAILIDSEKQTVSEIDIDKDDFLADCYRHIGNGCQLIEGVPYITLPRNNYMYVDEEGLYNEAQRGFTIDKCVFVGNAIIVGSTLDGNDLDTDCTPEEITELVSWLSDVSPFKF